MNSDQKNYEFAYLLSSARQEAEVSGIVAHLATIIQENGGVIRRQAEARKRQLAYPIKKERYGYFGWMTFGISSKFVSTLRKKMIDIPEILRCLIVEEDSEQYNTSLHRPFIPRTAPTHPKSSLSVTETKVGEEKLDLEALDKKLEEILGK